MHHTNDMVSIAQGYLQRGYSVIPVLGKRAACAWKIYTQKLASTADISYWWSKGEENPPNIGIICGRISGNLLVVDLDGESAVTAYHEAFPELCETLTVRTGSGRGEHLYYRTDALPPSSRVQMCGGLVELRGEGCYVVAPPSIHPDSHKPYQVIYRKKPMIIKNWRPVQEWMKVDTTPKAKVTLPTIKDSSRYGKAALLSEASRLAGQREGFRNNHLNMSAFRMGQLIGRGHLTRGDVEQTLLAVAAQVGMGQSEAEMTIRSGIDAGIAKAGHRS